MCRPPDYVEEKTPEYVFRERYDLFLNKLFQKAVWDLHRTGVPLKEAESLVAQESFVQYDKQFSYPFLRSRGGSKANRGMFH